jgi:predicted acyltransferase
MTVADSEYDLKAPIEPLKPREPILSPEIEVGREPTKIQRLASLDVFRGITIAAMLVVNNPGSWKHKYGPLEHAEWHGWTPTDLIFPFFLFIVGIAIPFSFAKRALRESKGEMLAHVWARALSLVLLGLLLHSLPSSGLEPVRPPGFTLLGILRVALLVFIPIAFIALLVPWRSRKISLLTPPIVAVLLLGLGYAIHFSMRAAVAKGLPDSFSVGGGLFYPSKLRLPGVLQRIGVCYGVAATIALLAGRRTVLLALIVLLAAYSVLMLRAPFAGHEIGSLSSKDNFARSVDVAVFDRAHAKHTYAEYPDPEGLVSTLPAIGSVLCGIFVGYALAGAKRTNVEKCAKLLANGVLVTILGVLLSWWLMPINKKIWTPSFTIFTAGMGMLTLGAVFYLTDVRGRRAWAWPFKVFGMNAIAAFILAGLLGRIGNVVKVTDARVPLIEFCKHHVSDAIHRAGDWWHNALPNFPPLDTANNVSLAWAIAFVFAVFMILLVMYAFKIFLKV